MINLEDLVCAAVDLYFFMSTGASVILFTSFTSVIVE